MTINERPTTYQPSIHPLAIISLVLSITGMLPILPLIGSIAGIITGFIARREIRDHPEQYTGDGYAKAGIILGFVTIVLVILAVCGLVLYMMPVQRISTGPSLIITSVP
jgi:uncharacterized membrane protein